MGVKAGIGDPVGELNANAGKGKQGNSELQRDRNATKWTTMRQQKS